MFFRKSPAMIKRDIPATKYTPLIINVESLIKVANKKQNAKRVTIYTITSFFN